MTRINEPMPPGAHGRHPNIQQRLAQMPIRPEAQGAARVRTSGRTSAWIAWSAIIVVIAGLLSVATYFAHRQNWINLPGLQSDSGSKSRGPTANAKTVFSGRASELRVAPGNTIQADPSDPSIVWIRSALKAASPNGATDGVAVQVPSSLWSESPSKRIRVTVSAKSGGGEATPFALAYSTGSARNSGWLVFEPTSEFKDFSFNFVVPQRTTGMTHYVGIWSDITGRGTPLAVRRVQITPLP